MPPLNSIPGADCGDTGIPYLIYENIPLEVKFGWMKDAPGSAVVDSARSMLSTIGSAYTGSDAILRAVVKTAGAEWTGTAADAAATSITRGADRGTTVGNASGGGRGLVGNYGQS